MRAWLYYGACSLKNQIKKILSSKFVIVILCSMIIGGVIGVGVGVISGFVLPEDAFVEETVDENGETVEEDEPILDINEDGVFDQTEIAFLKCLGRGGIMLALVVIVLYGILAGAKKGSDIFLMADVNLLFPAPMQPQTVLLFRMGFQIAAQTFAMIYLLFQLPNFVFNLGLPLGGTLIGIFGVLLLFLLQKVVSVLTYVLVANHPTIKGMLTPVVYGIGVLLIFLHSLAVLSCGNDPVAMIEKIYSNKLWYGIPIFGWLSGMIMEGFEGNYLYAFGFLVLLLLTMILGMYFIWRLKADFYEDAIGGAQKREEQLAAAREKTTLQRKTKVDKNGKAKERKIWSKTTLQGQGAVLFLNKELLARRRFASFGFFTKTMTSYIVVIFGICLLMLKVADSISMIPVGFVLLILVFFRAMGNPIGQETSRIWLLMVPDSIYKKVWYSLIAGNINTGLDILLPLVGGAIAMKANPAEAVLWFAGLVLTDFMISVSGLVLETLLPTSALDYVKQMLQLTIRFLLFAVCLACLMAGLIMGNMILGLGILCMVCAGLGGAFFWLYPALLN